MSAFPTAFYEKELPLIEVPNLSQVGHAALSELHEKGLTVTYGITEAAVPEVLEIANMPEVVEFCPNDKNGKRFNQPWLGKGRGFFNFRANDDGTLKAYSWAGIERIHELPNHPTTTAFRTTVRKSGLLVVQATVEGTRALYGDVPEVQEGIGLETWASNTAAVITYVRAGAQLVMPKSEEFNEKIDAAERIYRPTLNPAEHDFMLDGEYHRYDTRLFMGFPAPTE